MMKIGRFAAILLASTAVPATASTITQNFSGPGSYSVDRFDPSLGTLNAITANVTGGSATYKIKVNGPLSTSTSYNAKAYFGIYLGPLTIDGNVQGSGTATFNLGETDISLPVVPYSLDIPVPTDLSTSSYNALIGAGTTSSSLTVDPPFTLTFGDLSGFYVNDVSLTSKSATWSLVYDYTPLRSGVPEPASWSLMLVGFSATGMLLRMRRKVPICD